jgi:PAS domain S-box-containing protein
MGQDPVKEEIIQGFFKDQEPLIRRRVNIILLIGGTLVPFFGGVDYILYPEHFKQFMTYRLLTAAFCLALYVINRQWDLGSKSFYLGVAGYYITGFSIIGMVVETNGYASPYYAGLNLVFLTFCTVLTIRIRYVIVHCITLYLMFLLIVLLFDYPNKIDIFLGNNMFIVSTIVIILVASFFNQKLRWTEYLLRKDLEEAQAQLKHYSRDLEHTVAESEEKYRLVVENANEAILVLQGDLFQFANPKALELFGYSKDALCSRPYSEFLHPADREVVADRLEKHLHSRLSPEPYSFRIIDKEGKIRWLEIRMAVVAWEGQPAALNLLSDITERKSAEAALQEAHEELERRVKERTAELEAAQEELVRRERFAVLGNLIAIVSHELRNPLGTIRASLFAIDDRARGKGLEVERALDRAERNIVRCDKIIEELLDYARSHDLDWEPTVLDEWLAELLDEQTLPEGIELTLDLGAGVIVKLDRERFRRCLLNVIGNACQAMTERELDEDADEAAKENKSLMIASRVVGDRLEIRVIDTGTGIHPEELAKIFQPLYSTKGFGVGLGLPIVKQLMEQHGGGVEVESKPGKGTKVTLWLPISNP